MSTHASLAVQAPAHADGACDAREASPWPASRERLTRLATAWLACAGQQRLSAASVELLPMLCSLAHDVRLARGPRIGVNVRVEPGCPPCLVDRQGLEEALLDLVSNACSAMPTGGRLLFSAGPCHLPDGIACIELSVSDSGTGMTREVAALAMQPFFTTKTRDRWAGLGLAAVAGFSRQSGGHIALHSAPGSGTVVKLHLPECVPACR